MRNLGNWSLVTVDGTDCPIQEPHPFSTQWYSHKFKGPGLRYELAVCILTGYIVWYFGPFPAGKSDLQIYRIRLKTILGPNEKVVADKGYRGDYTVDTPFDAKSDVHKKMMNTARARHETINARLKKWGVLKQEFRHHRSKHGQCFEAVAAVTQLEIQNGCPPFQVDYNDIFF